MFSYLRAKRDLQLVLSYQKDLNRLWQIEAAAAGRLQDGHGTRWVLPSERQALIQQEASQDPDYQIVRDRVARATNKMLWIARRNGVAVDMKSLPAPAVGGAIIPINVFDAVLRDISHGGIDQQWIVDAVNQTRGEAVERVQDEFWKLINPFHWLKDLLVAIIRLPFTLIEASGFSVEKVEEHFLGKLFKLAEVALLIYVAVKLGFTKDELKELFEKLFVR